MPPGACRLWLLGRRLSFGLGLPALRFVRLARLGAKLGEAGEGLTPLPQGHGVPMLLIGRDRGAEQRFGFSQPILAQTDRPKMSLDGIHWLELPRESFQLAARPESNQGILTLEVGPEPLWIAAQEFVSRDELETWSRNLERLPFVNRSEIGRSIAGTPLHCPWTSVLPAGGLT